MTTGNVSKTDGNTSPIRPARPPPPPPSEKVENRPELVGGLPLWLTMGAVTQVRRFAEVFNFAPFAALRRRTIATVENKIVQNQSATDRDLPVGRALRKIADAMEEELASMRMCMATLRAELTHSHAEVNVLRKQMEFMKLKNAEDVKTDSEKALSSTASHLRFLLCKEQTRATASEKKLQELEKRLKSAEMNNSLVAGDLVKVSLLYTSLVAAFVGFLLDSPVGPQLLHYLMSVGG